MFFNFLFFCVAFVRYLFDNLFAMVCCFEVGCLWFVDLPRVSCQSHVASRPGACKRDRIGRHTSKAQKIYLDLLKRPFCTEKRDPFQRPFLGRKG